MFLVYVATGPCGKKYVGATSRSLYQRQTEHRRRALEEGSNSKFHRAIRLHGFDSFKWHIAFYCSSVAEMFAKEIYTIQKNGSFKNGYNSTQGGEGTIRGRSAHQIVKRSKSKPNPKGYL